MKRPLRDRTSVCCGFPEAAFRLDAYFASRQAPDGIARLHLRVPMNDPPNPHAFYYERIVRIEARRPAGDGRTGESIAIWWGPEGKMAFPTFEGTLAAWMQDERSSLLELDGAYHPPFDANGQPFDEAIGERIARSTAHELLTAMKRAVESQCSC